MNIIVCLKQIVDLEQVRVRSQTREPVLEGLPLLLGAFDKNALEAAVAIKEKQQAHVTALSVGSPKLADTIKEALAMGADEAVIVTGPRLGDLDAALSARILAAAVQKIGSFDLILAGEGSSDQYSGQVPSRLAELLGLPQITYVRRLAVQGGRVQATRDLERCLEVVEAELPALVSVTSELNEPRLPPLTAILQAARKPLHQWSLADLGLQDADIEPTGAAVQTLSNLAPEQQRKGMVLEGPPEEVADQLLDQLIRDGQIQ